MKKIILLIGISVVFLSCNQQTKENDKIKNNDNSTLANKSSDSDLLQSVDCKDDIIVVLDRNLVDDDWVNNNPDLFCNKKILDPSVSDYLIVNVDKTGKDEIEIAKWLSDNNDKISFRDSYPFIRRAHLLTDHNKIKEIEDKLTSPYLDLDLDYFKDYYKKSYASYMEFGIDANGKVTAPSEKAPSNIGKYSYSIPFFKSIINCYKIDKSDYKNYKLKFVTLEGETPLHVKYNYIAFKLETPTFSEYYDYSTNPGISRPSTTVLYRINYY